ADVPAPPRRVPANARARRAGSAGVPAPTAARRAAEPADVRPLAGRPAQPARRPGDDEPPVGRFLRPRPRADHGGLRLPGRAADALRAARLARGRIHGPQMVAETDAPADRDECDLPAGVVRHPGIAGEGWRQQAAGARPARAAGGGTDPR